MTSSSHFVETRSAGFEVALLRHNAPGQLAWPERMIEQLEPGRTPELPSRPPPPEAAAADGKEVRRRFAI